MISLLSARSQNFEHFGIAAGHIQWFILRLAVFRYTAAEVILLVDPADRLCMQQSGEGIANYNALGLRGKGGILVRFCRICIP